MKSSLTPIEFVSALRNGFAWLEINQTLLDRLNVFPVPDGDTGQNMTSTLASGIETFPDKISDAMTLSDLAEPFITELTRSSRGNSGFILARFFYGFFEIAVNRETLDVQTWIAGIANGSFHVNRAMFAPVEGTIISILTAVNQTLSDYDGNDIIEVLRIIEASGTEALFHTPKQLPVLARAGVVDSGALGILCLFRGILAGATDGTVDTEREEEYRFEPDANVEGNSNDILVYRYCTEAVVEKNGKEDAELIEWLKSLGDCIALVNETELLKLHIHTNEPEVVFQRLETLGTIEQRKVDDMEKQSRLVSAGRGKKGELSILAFVPGDGFERIFEDFGVGNCFVYKENLPSPEDILNTLNNIVEDQIIILPNNSNIIPSVMAVKDLSDKSLIVLPTKSVVQGITASYGFVKEDDAETNINSMSGFLDAAIALSVYISVNDSRFGDWDLKEGQWFVTQSDEILGVGDTTIEAILKAVDSLDISEVSDVAVYPGNDFDPRELDSLIAALRHKLPEATIEHHFGGQKRTALIISLE